jgi:hypothetical protein
MDGTGEKETKKSLAVVRGTRNTAWRRYYQLILSFLFFLIKKETKKSRTTRLLRRLPGHPTATLH